MRSRITLALILVMAFAIPVTTPLTSAQAAACGLPSAAFCDTFDAPAGTGNRSGQLNGTVWGVSRLSSNMNFCDGCADPWAAGPLVNCDGSTTTVRPPQDIIICNGQVHEVNNDGGSVDTLAMYPKQPFDFAGRTGIVTFDVSNNTAGNHAFWPEFWMSDKPVPAPFEHGGDLENVPQHGFGLRFSAAASPGTFGLCPNANNSTRWTLEDAVVSRNWQVSGLNVQRLDCVTAPSGPNGGLNHVEVHVSQNQIDVYATDAGTTTPLKHIAQLTNANLSFTRGLIWIEDSHYNAEKSGNNSYNTFAWDNIGFDGPVLPRDLANDAPDASNTQLGKQVVPGQTVNWSVPGVTNISQATGAILTASFWYENAPINFTYKVNGNIHTLAWPFPTSQSFTSRSFAFPVPLSDIVTGTNTVSIGGNQAMNVDNVDLVLIGAGGGGSPSTPQPTPTATRTPTAAPTNTPVPSAIATAVPTDTPVPAATATPTATTTPQSTCAVLVLINGQQTAVTRPPEFCTNQ